MSEPIENTLRQSEERYRLLAEQVMDGIFVADSHRRYVDANRAGCEMLGYSLEELLALSIPDVLVADELERLPAHYEQIATARSTRSEWRFRRKDGSVFIGELVGCESPDGRFTGIVRDVTERKRTEAESEAQAIMDAAPVAIFVARDPRCMEIRGNRMAHELTQLSPGTNLSMSAPEGQRPGSLRFMKEGSEIPIHELPLQKAAATGKAIYGAEFDLLCQDGRVVSLIGNAVPLLGNDGRPEGSIGIFLDISEHKRINEALRVSEERFRVALKNSPVVVFSQDRELRYTWINSPVLGWAVQGYRGQTDAEIVGGEEGARLMAIKQSVLRNGIGTRTETTVTFQGETHYFDLTVEPLRDALGVIVGVICSAADITPLKKLAMEIEHRLALDLETSRDEIRALAASLMRAQEDERRRVSRELHDHICHQLGSLAREIGNLADGPLPSENVRAKLEEIRARVVETSQETQHIAHQMHTSVLDDLGLVASLKDLCSQFSEQYPDIALDFENCDLPASMRGEVSTCLYRVAEESLQNIAKHSGAKNSSVRLGSITGAALLTIRDDGAGFDVMEVKGKGGLGLINMKERAHSINGKLTITGRVGYGTQIALEVPSHVEQPMERPRVLLADDHSVVLEEIRSLLAPNYEIVETVADGSALVEAALRLKPDVIVVDITMPQLSGIDAAVQIKKSLPEVKLVFVTMHASTAYLRAAFEAGGTGYVLKSGLRDELPVAVQSVLGDRTYVSCGLSTEYSERLHEPTRATHSSSRRSQVQDDASDR